MGHQENTFLLYVLWITYRFACDALSRRWVHSHHAKSNQRRKGRTDARGMLQSERFDNILTTPDNEAWLDIKTNGLFGSRYPRTFFDVIVFNPHTKLCPNSIGDPYKDHNPIKKSTNEERVVNVEKSTFSPLISSRTGATGTSVTKAMKRLASLISDKRYEPYAHFGSYVRANWGLPDSWSLSLYIYMYIHIYIYETFLHVLFCPTLGQFWHKRSYPI